MTNREFSNEFDVLLRSFSNNSDIVLDDYEKSVYLTEFQYSLVKSLYDGSYKGESLESTEKLRRSLDSLIKSDYPEAILTSNNTVSDKSRLFKLKPDVWFVTYESVELIEDSYCKDNKVVEVYPVKHDEWHKIKNNPFKRPNKRKIARLDNGNNIVELISEYPFQSYFIKYLSKPSPIILSPLGDGLTIEGESKETNCELNTVLHRVILEGAVQLALSTNKSNASS